MKTRRFENVMYKKIFRILAEGNLSERTKFDYGDYLFADLDLDVDNVSQLKKFIKKWYPKDEPNTDDEMAFLDDLQAYTGDNEPGNLVALLKILKPLKNKFPGVLDPTATTKKTNLVYRGTVINVKNISERNAKYTTYFAEYNDEIEFKYTGKKFMSFSIDRYVAREFATDFGDHEYKTMNLIKSGLIPAILCIPISDPNLIVNPDFVKIFAPPEFDIEAETFYLGNTIKSSKTLIPTEVLEVISDNFDQIPDKYKPYYKKILKPIK